MTIQLTGDGEEIVRSFIEDGRFTSEDEVIDAALRLLQERDEQAKCRRNPRSDSGISPSGQSQFRKHYTYVFRVGCGVPGTPNPCPALPPGAPSASFEITHHGNRQYKKGGLDHDQRSLV